jgi:hypothetical protein
VSAPAAASAPASGPASPSASTALDPDAGLGSCRVLRGPIELPYKGAVTLTASSASATHGEVIESLQNDDGRPRTVAFPVGPATTNAPPTPESADSGDGRVSGVTHALAVSCAAAGDRVYCPDRSGAVHRARSEGSDDRVVASSRGGSRIAAAALETHGVLAYLASRKTSEGWVSEAWLAVDDEPPLRLSEDGSGATSVALAAYKSGLMAVTVDARTALTAMHARPVAYDGRVKLGEDTVVFVGGPGDRRTGAAVAIAAGGAGWALLPIAKDVGTFGLAVVRLDAPLHVDEPVVWSMYPNGLDPAPIAAVQSGPMVWVARVLPESADPGARRVLQLGRIDALGAFDARDRVTTRGNPSDVALAADTRGALWVGWLDPAGAWVERLACR